MARSRIRKNNPSVSRVHTNRPLTNVSIAFVQNSNRFFARRLFPVVPVMNKSDSYYVWDRASFNRDDVKIVGPGQEYPVGVLKLSDDNYNCKVRKYSEMVADEEASNADAPLNLEITKTQSVMRKHLIRQDRQFAADYLTTGIWTGSTTQTDIVPGTKWNAGSSTPIADVKAQVRSLMKKGLDPDNMCMALPLDVFHTLQDHPDVLARFENVQEVSALNEAQLAAVLGIGEVVVMTSVYNDAVEGQTATAANDKFIFGTDDALLVYKSPAPALETPSGGYTMVWAGLTGSNNQGIQTSRLRRDELDAVQIRGRAAWDNKLVAPECGVYFNDVLT